MQLKSRVWPVELKQPIIIEQIQSNDPNLKKVISPEDSERALFEAVSVERGRRVIIISEFLGQELPASDAEWLLLIVAICEHWNIPAFQMKMKKPRGPGATKFWTDEKHCQLFADVQYLAKGKLSEHGACKFIAAKPEKFGRRYLRPDRTRREAWNKTIHRQFIAAKRKIKSDRTFRAVHFTYGFVFGFGPEHGPEYGPAFIDDAIKRYAYAQNSSQVNSA